METSDNQSWSKAFAFAFVQASQTKEHWIVVGYECLPPLGGFRYKAYTWSSFFTPGEFGTR